MSPKFKKDIQPFRMNLRGSGETRQEMKIHEEDEADACQHLLELQGRDKRVEPRRSAGFFCTDTYEKLKRFMPNDLLEKEIISRSGNRRPVFKRFSLIERQTGNAANIVLHL